MTIGKDIPRVDAFDKVTGRAKYADDLVPTGTLIAKVLHSTIANGLVKKIDTSKAKQLPGVIEVFTCFDVPDIVFPTAGHPWSTNIANHDIADRKLLNTRVRYYGDDIAVVVAETELTATEALKLIEVEYEEYAPLLTIEDAMNGDALHEEYPNNVLASTKYNVGGVSFEEAIENNDVKIFEDEFEVPTVQHCFMENPNSYAYMESGKIVVVTSTQIPHIVRRVIGQALDIPWGQVRVIKPYIGGGFGAKQDVLYEPLNAWVSKMLGGKCVKLELTREEGFINTRVRHAMKIHIKSAVSENGRLIARKVKMFSNQGGYASHGHSVVAGAAHVVKQLYQDEVATDVEFTTVFTNLPVAGAMRGYGVPQITFALEAHMENIAKEMNFDNIELRKINMIKEGFVDPLNTIPSLTNELDQCIEIGAKHLNFREKHKKYSNQEGHIRKGVGCAIFSYKTGVYPISLETASCRMILNQDGSIQVQVGATEIGQGADTVFTQMAAEITGITYDKVYIMSAQDTDVTPYDSGAYASRQTYVSGHAVKKCGLELKQKILDYANYLKESEIAVDIKENHVLDKDGNKIIHVSEVAIESFYHRENSKHIAAEATHHCDTNTIAHGTTFVEIEVDLKLGLVKILDIINVHDSGTIINPKTALGQVHGGVSMGIAYALSEELLFNPKTGEAYNGDLLGYKIPTSLDSPDISCKFVEKYDPSGPFGNKALGEPPTVPVAPAIRNALFNATGIKYNQIPLTPERIFNKAKDKGLI
ncbi:xanthine dehydrogenase molybdenum-binding subunit XdhA [Mycoplasmatota bacterium zrk1]